MKNIHQLDAVRIIAATVVEAVDAAGEAGAPGGVLFAGLMQYGCTLTQFTSLMDALVYMKLLTRDGDLYHVA